MPGLFGELATVEIWWLITLQAAKREAALHPRHMETASVVPKIAPAVLAHVPYSGFGGAAGENRPGVSVTGIWNFLQDSFQKKTKQNVITIRLLQSPLERCWEEHNLR